MFFCANHSEGRRQRKLLCLTALAMLWGLIGCNCESEPEPPPPPAEISIRPTQTWVAPSDTFPGQKVYQTFSIKNVGRNVGERKAENLKVESIKMEGNTEDFKLLDQCPSGAPPECKDMPSLPQEVEVDKSISFTILFTASTKAVLDNAIIRVVSNGKNDDNDPTRTDRITLQPPLGEAYIDVALQATGDKEFVLPFGKVEKGQGKEDTFIITSNGKTNLEFYFEWEGDVPGSYQILDDAGKSVFGSDGKGTRFNLAPPNNKTFTVKYNPDSCGSHESRLILRSNAISRKPTANGESASGPALFIRFKGSSPAGAAVSPAFVDFQNVVPGQSATKTFKIQVSDQGVCDLQVFGLTIGELEGQTPPKNFKIAELRKGGAKVDPPTDAKPITLSKGEELEVDISYSPQQQGGESGVVKIKTNDPDFDPGLKGAVTISGGTEVNIRPSASFRFICEEGGAACNKGDDLGLTIFLSGENRVKVVLDGSKSTDKENKIVKYTWEFVAKPDQAVTITDADKQMASFLVTGRGKWSVKLTVEDHGGIKDSITKVLSAQ